MICSTMGFADKKIYSFFFVTLLFFINSGSSSTVFNIVNHCSYTVFPGLLSGSGSSPLPTTGFSLKSSESRLISIPTTWSGRIWARTHCHQTSTTGKTKFFCKTGDCGSSQIECFRSGPNSPATVAEFKLNSTRNLDLYDVSLLDGYNIPMSIVPNGGVTGFDNCNAVRCAANINDMCPHQLKVMVEEAGETAVACKSTCEVFRTQDFCCRVEFGTPDTCNPNEYSGLFKEACQTTVYEKAYEDKTKPCTCSGGSDYTITFCPIPFASVKKNSALTSLQQETISVSAASSTTSIAFSLGVLAVAIFGSGIW